MCVKAHWPFMRNLRDNFEDNLPTLSLYGGENIINNSPLLGKGD